MYPVHCISCLITDFWISCIVQYFRINFNKTWMCIFSCFFGFGRIVNQMPFVWRVGSAVQVNSRWFEAEKSSKLQPDSEFLVFMVLAGVPVLIASAALPSPSSSIIYVATARTCPEIPTPQSFNFLLPELSELLTSLSPVSRRGLGVTAAPDPLGLSQLQLLTPAPLSVAGQQGSWGCRSLLRTAEADMGEEVSNGSGRLGPIHSSSLLLLRPNLCWLRVKYVCPHLPLIVSI